MTNLAGRRVRTKVDKKLARLDIFWRGSWKGREFWKGGGRGATRPSEIWRGNKNLEGTLEGDRGRDKIRGPGRSWKGTGGG